MTIRAVYENGVFRPIETVVLPERCEVDIDVRPINGRQTGGDDDSMTPGMAKVYEILGRKHSSGFTDTAERHNEHQP